MQDNPATAIRAKVTQTIESLSESDLQRIIECVAFLKFRARTHQKPRFDQNKLAALYAEFAGEDRKMAEEGINDYAADLLVEDAK